MKGESITNMDLSRSRESSMGNNLVGETFLSKLVSFLQIVLALVGPATHS
jgi:hypothetical protein